MIFKKRAQFCSKDCARSLCIDPGCGRATWRGWKYFFECEVLHLNEWDRLVQLRQGVILKAVSQGLLPGFFEKSNNPFGAVPTEMLVITVILFPYMICE